MSLQFISIIILIFILSFHQTSASECTVTQTVKFDDCILYCWNKYQGLKDFYNFQTGNCSQRVICGPGYYNDYQNNICIDQFGGYILKELGYVFKVKQQIMRFVKLIVLQGYTVGNKLICDDGWKSSSNSFLYLSIVKTQKKSNISIIIYLCDQQLKDGEIYPKTHGEYFFQKFTLQQQVYVMDTVLGTDDLLTFFTLKNNLFIVFTSLYLFLNFLACCTSKGNSKSSSYCCCCKKSKNKNDKLSESQANQIKQFLEKRKQQSSQKLKQLKIFSLKEEFNQQMQVLKNIKVQKQEKQKKRWRKRFQQKQQQKKQNQNQKKQRVKK